MIVKSLIIPLLVMTWYESHANAYCIPCPTKGITLASFINCDCPLPQFYDESINKCVNYTECPLSQYNSPLPDIKAMAPVYFEVLSKSLDSANPKNIKIPKDINLLSKAVRKRLEEVRKRLPALLGPLFGAVALKNRDLFETCGKDMTCLIRGVLKRRENYYIIFPKLKEVLDEVINIFYKVFDDLKEIYEKECGDKKEDCPLIKNLLLLKTLLPGNLEEIRDIQIIATQLGKFFLDDFKHQLGKNKKNEEL